MIVYTPLSLHIAKMIYDKIKELNEVKSKK